jgi:hypothetical protein
VAATKAGRKEPEAAKMRIQRIVLTLGLVLTLTGCAGQLGTSGSAPVEPGQRLRLKVSSATPPRQTGTLVALTGDSVVIRTAVTGQAGTDTVRLAFPLTAVTTVERSLGVHGNALQGAVYGGQIGLITVLLGFAGGQWAPGDTQSNVVFVGSMVGGAAIGAAVRSEHWRRVPMSSLRVGVVPLPAGRFGVGATFSLQR